MYKINKGFIPVAVAFLVAVILGSGGYVVHKYFVKSTQPLCWPYCKDMTDKDREDILKEAIKTETITWKTHANSEIGYSISYPPNYHFARGDNLFNYDEKVFERGNPDGTKIQIQSANAALFDVNVELGRQKFIDSLNGSTNGEAQETPIVPFSLNAIKYKNAVLIGPGETFDVYYAFPDNPNHVSTGSSGGKYFRILVWGDKNDRETVSKILATFKPAQNATMTNWRKYRNDIYGFEFKHPQDVIFRPLSTRFVSLTDGIEADIPASYNAPNSFQRSQKIYIEVVSTSTSAECLSDVSIGVFQPSLDKPLDRKMVIAPLFSKYERREDCTMNGCGVGNTYREWRNNTCYSVSSFAIQANPSKTYDAGSADPRTIEALHVAQAVTKKITTLTEEILSTFTFFEPKLSRNTANWKDYKNEKYGFEFKYPETYSTIVPTYQSSDYPTVVDISYTQKGTYAPQIMRVLVDDRSNPSSIEEYFKMYPIRDGNSGKEYVFKDFTQRFIGGNFFYSILTERFEGTLAFNYYTLINKKVFVFLIQSQGVDWTNPNLDIENDFQHAVFRQIISTFKFL